MGTRSDSFGPFRHCNVSLTVERTVDLSRPDQTTRWTAVVDLPHPDQAYPVTAIQYEQIMVDGATRTGRWQVATRVQYAHETTPRYVPLLALSTPLVRRVDVDRPVQRLLDRFEVCKAALRSGPPDRRQRGDRGQHTVHQTMMAFAFELMLHVGIKVLTQPPAELTVFKRREDTCAPGPRTMWAFGQCMYLHDASTHVFIMLLPPTRTTTRAIGEALVHIKDATAKAPIWRPLHLPWTKVPLEVRSHLRDHGSAAWTTQGPTPFCRHFDLLMTTIATLSRGQPRGPSGSAEPPMRPPVRSASTSPSTARPPVPSSTAPLAPVAEFARLPSLQQFIDQMPMPRPSPPSVWRQRPRLDTRQPVADDDAAEATLMPY